MTLLSRTPLLALLLLCGAALARPGEESALPDLGGDAIGTPVRARLIAEVDALVPGDSLLVGVHLAQEEGWHTYWKNGGDSGLPTEVRWELPAGYSVSELMWPTPHRYVEAGDLVTFGYEGDVVLLARLRVPAGASGSARIAARVEWLMCKELCVPGEQQVELRLPVASEARRIGGRDRELIAAAIARLPRPSPSIEVTTELSAVPAGQAAHAAVVVRAGADVAWTWFPEAVDGLLDGEVRALVVDEDLWLVLAFELVPGAEAGGELRWGGVLELERDGRTEFVDVRIPVRVAAEGEILQARDPELFGRLLGGGGLFDQDFASATGDAGGRGLLHYLLLALLGGVILNVMPCVLPVLSLKVMGFVSHAGERRSVQVRLGLTFALGVLVSFLALASVVIALQAAGDQLGWGFQFQNPVFVVVMAAVVFAFGLSLFGVYEILLPVRVGQAGKGGAYAESFLNGVLATALATPCTAPFLGTALGFAFTQPAWAILSIFLAIGAGLALPYVLLSLNPAWLRFVPRPGAWMDRFKQGMGFLLMATLVWLLWVLGQQIGTDGVVWTLAFLLVLGFALWLYGSALTLSSSTARRMVVHAVVVALVAGGWWQFLREPLDPERVAAVSAATSAQGEDGWETFSVERLEREVAAGNTVFVDFTAAWCTTCKVNEKTVLATDAVRERLRQLGVVTLLGDWTQRDPEITRVLRQFGRSGVPFYAVFPAGRLDQPVVLPEIITQGIVLDALEQAGPSRSAASR